MTVKYWSMSSMRSREKPKSIMRRTASGTARVATAATSSATNAAATVAPGPAGRTERRWQHFGLGGIILAAVVLRLWRLDQNGYGTEYYSAGVRSMLASWHNFLFNAFDPAGFVSLDKPPVAFWIQTLSAQLLGFSPFSVLLPQLIEGVCAIVLLYVLVRRRFGEIAGLVAALAFALTPVAVAVDRSNNTESCLVLVLLFAAWAAIRACETAHLRYLLLCAAAIGVGFNTKMLVASGIVPVIALIYLLWAPARWHLRFAQLGVAGIMLAAVSLAWVLLYEATPPADRPFVDSSPDNPILQ